MRVDEHTIELAGSPVFFRSAGSSEDPILYLHGVPTSSDDWIPFLERTGGLAPDLLGFGRSAKGGHLDFSPAGQADFLDALLDHLDIAQIRLAAHDYGVAAGLTFASRNPGRISRIVICNAVPLFAGHPPTGPARLWRRPLIGELVMGAATQRLLARTLRRGSVSAAAWPQERIAAIWEQFDQGTQRAILRVWRSMDPPWLTHAAGMLADLDMPTLVVWGERDPWLAPELAREYAGRLVGARAELLPAAGHWPWLDDPSAIGRIAAFLDAAPTA